MKQLLYLNRPIDVDQNQKKTDLDIQKNCLQY